MRLSETRAASCRSRDSGTQPLCTAPSRPPELEEDVLVYEAEGVVQLADDTGEHALLLRLRLLLVTGARRRVRDCDLRGRLGTGQSHRGLRTHSGHAHAEGCLLQKRVGGLAFT